jgi:TusA-related sulfurtransferase
MADATLDAGAENCGRLIGLVVDAIAQLAPGQALAVKAYDPSSQVDLAAWCRMTGHRLRSTTPVADHLELVIEKTQNRKEAFHGTRDDPQHARQG